MHRSYPFVLIALFLLTVWNCCQVLAAGPSRTGFVDGDVPGAAKERSESMETDSDSPIAERSFASSTTKVLDTPQGYPSSANPLRALDTPLLEQITSHLNPQDMDRFRQTSREHRQLGEGYSERRLHRLVRKGRVSWYEAATRLMHAFRQGTIDKSVFARQFRYVLRHSVQVWTAVEWRRLFVKAKLLRLENAEQFLVENAPQGISFESLSVETSWGEKELELRARQQVERFLQGALPPDELSTTPWIDLTFADGNRQYSLMSVAATAKPSRTELGDRLQRVQQFREYGADPQIATSFLNEMAMPMYSCYRIHVVQELLDRGVPVDNRGVFGETPLHKAATFNCIEIAKFLLQRGADVNAQDRSGETPLLKASRGGHSLMVLELLQYGANDRLVNKQGVSPFYIAASRGNVDLIHIFVARLGASPDVVDQRAANGETPLFGAVLSVFPRKLEAARILLEMGADPNATSAQGWTPLLRVLRVADHHGVEQVVKLLLKHGADPNAQFPDSGLTAIEHALQSRNFELMQVMEEYKV